MTNADIEAPDSLDRELRRRELRELLPSGGRVLEVGAGPNGLLARSFKTDIFPMRGVDVVADGAALPFRSQAFDHAACIDVLEHVDPTARAAVVREMARVTRSRVVVAGPSGAAAAAADVALARWFRRRRAPVPAWLSEHLDHQPYPEQDGIAAAVQRLASIERTSVSCRAHRWITRAESIRGGHRLMSAAYSLMPAVVASLARANDAPYRQVVVFDLDAPLFSVIMATRNRADRVVKAARSVLDQSMADLELILVDDASTDATPAVLDELRRVDERVRVVRRDRPSGSCGRARNSGLDTCRGRNLAFCDDDVQWRTDHLEQCAAALERSEACYTRGSRWLADGTYVDDVGRPRTGRPVVGDLDANCLAVRRSAMEPFPNGSGRYSSEDIRLAQQLYDHGRRIAFVDAVTVDYEFNVASYCYTYEITQTDGVVSVSSRPRITGARSLVGRLSEALAARVGRRRGVTPTAAE
ncbi:MAG: hypothetical protein QOD92_3547 [Acidimicrobiaceae bacterium]|jgi:hypothetical protein